MRTLSPALLAAQTGASRTPYLKVEASNKLGGAVRLDWERLYSGAEPDYFHALAVGGDGSLNRFRVTLPGDNRRLLRQRVASPGPASDFSVWTDTGRYGVLAVAACSLGNAISLFWIESDRLVYRRESADNGASWGTPEIIGTAAGTAALGITAAYKTNGDIAVFFTDAATLYLAERIGGVWQPVTSWDKTTGDLSGVSCVYDDDWNLVVTGKDAAGNGKIWSLVYGDGGGVTAGTWSDLKEMATAASGSGYGYCHPFMVKSGATRCFFVEKFSDAEAYNRPFVTHAIPGSEFADNLWREPLPFNLASEYGLAMAYGGGCAWLSSPGGVWRAESAEQTLDLSRDIVSVKEERRNGVSNLTVELANSDGRYAAPGAGGLGLLVPGSEIELGMGYITGAGAETGGTFAFQLDGLEHTSGGGKASLILHASGGWERLREWTARRQFRWNKSGNEASVREIIAFILARAGIALEVRSESAVIGGFFPDFTAQTGESGTGIIGELLSLVPDALFIEGNTAYLLNPQETDASGYTYGDGHAIFDGKYVEGVSGISRVIVEGYDVSAGGPVIVSSFGWDEIESGFDRVVAVRDRNIGTAAEAEDRGEIYLRKARVASAGGVIRSPLNCGVELYDVIEITDIPAGLVAAKRRIAGIVSVYDSRRGLYEQRLELSGV